MTDSEKHVFVHYLTSEIGPSKKAIFKGSILAFKAVVHELCLRTKKVMDISLSKSKAFEIVSLIHSHISETLRNEEKCDFTKVSKDITLVLYLVSDILLNAKNAPMPNVGVYV